MHCHICMDDQPKQMWTDRDRKMAAVKRIPFYSSHVSIVLQHIFLLSLYGSLMKYTASGSRIINLISIVQSLQHFTQARLNLSMQCGMAGHLLNPHIENAHKYNNAHSMSPTNVTTTTHVKHVTHKYNNNHKYITNSAHKCNNDHPTHVITPAKHD